MPNVDRRKIYYRKYRNVNIDNFKRDITLSSDLNTLIGSSDELAERYITGLSRIIDKHAPVISRENTISKNEPWYTSVNSEAKRQCRKAERIYVRTHDKDKYKEYRALCSTKTRKLELSKTTYYSSKIADSHSAPKTLYKITNQLLSDHHTNRLPQSVSDLDLAIKFGVFFFDKIVKIRANFTSNGIVNHDQSRYITTHMTNLQPTTCDEIKQIISASAPKHCELDPIPTWLLKSCLDELLPLLTAMFNASLLTGEYPHQFKRALVKPLLKHGKLDTNELQSYRPVSNLHFISKILEKLVVSRLDIHLQNESLHDPFQSAYKTGYSTETALSHLSNSILTHMDSGSCTLLAALDLSAAFDTIDHTMFISRLSHLYGVGGTALKWFKSYLKDREQCVSINNVQSKSLEIISGVPQGSVLGARLFTMYTQPLSDIITRHRIKYNCYADDTQLYIECDNNNASIDEATNKLEQCIQDICIWMNSNALKLNEAKTEFIIFNNKINYAGLRQLVVGSNTVKATNELKILGVTLDYKMTLEKQVTNTCRSAHIQTRKIRSIRKYLTDNACKTLTQALVTSKLDYCNIMYVGLPLKTVRRLQLTQNNAARVVGRVSRYNHISNTLKSLHWLPINKRCQFKTLTMTYKALHMKAPSYICESLNWYRPTRNLRSSSTTSLAPGRHRSIRIGKRLLDTSTATLWNSLPSHIKAADTLLTFKKLVKTFLFTL